VFATRSTHKYKLPTDHPQINHHQNIQSLQLQALKHSFPTSTDQINLAIKMAGINSNEACKGAAPGMQCTVQKGAAPGTQCTVQKGAAPGMQCTV
jgi:hypothetical protein